jgi:hypothetical protein
MLSQKGMMLTQLDITIYMPAIPDLSFYTLNLNLYIICKTGNSGVQDFKNYFCNLFYGLLGCGTLEPLP